MGHVAMPGDSLEKPRRGGYVNVWHGVGDAEILLNDTPLPPDWDDGDPCGQLSLLKHAAGKGYQIDMLYTTAS